MPSVFSPTGFNNTFTSNSSILNQDLQDFEDYSGVSTSQYHVCRGELHSPSHDTGSFPYLRNNVILPL
jgi:hypothetical protein